jgi:ADP-ribosylglycohydrolase
VPAHFRRSHQFVPERTWSDDTDSVACVAGGFAGAFHGIGSIPQRYFNSLKGMNMLDEKITRLLSKGLSL